MFNCLLYGEAGTGKTPFVATLEEYEPTSPCLFLDVDLGTMSVRNTNITIVDTSDWKSMQKVYTLLRKACDTKSVDGWSELAEFADVPIKQYKSVVIDSGTELEYVCRQVVLSDAVALNPSHDSEAPEQRDYLKTGERMKRLWRAFISLPITVVMTAGVRDLKDERDGSLRHFPSFQPAFSRDIIRMTDLIMYMSVTTKDKVLMRTLQTTLSQRIVARDRGQELPPYVVQSKFDFASLLKGTTKY